MEDEVKFAESMEDGGFQCDNKNSGDEKVLVLTLSRPHSIACNCDCEMVRWIRTVVAVS